MKIALIEGASTAYGSGSGEYGGWAAALHRDSIGYNETHAMNPWVVTNLAIPGFTISAVNKTFAESRPNHINGTSNSLVRLLSVGENEPRIAPDMATPIVSISAFATQLEVFCEATNKVGGTAIFVGPPRVNQALTNPCADTGWTINNDHIEEYDALIKKVAINTGAPYIDTASILSAYPAQLVMAADGRHPNATGHSMVHSAVKSAIFTTTLLEK